MELQFNKSVCKSLSKVLNQSQSQELTLEVKLPEALPDIGRVVSSWGQVVLRSKEWQGNCIGISGGVMAWVLYVPEDGSSPKSLEAWIPFQMKWDIPDVKRDGNICICPLVTSIDSRCISARKIMVRTTVSVLAEAFEPVETEIYQCDRHPDDLQLLKQTYPLDLPVEAGEKLLQLDDALPAVKNDQSIEKVCYYNLNPKITEIKVLTDKLLFRGKVYFHMLYLTQDGSFQTLEHEFSFSQFAHLDSEYSFNAKGWTQPIVTGVEVDLTGEQPVLKASISVQYIIYDLKLIEITEDAYSTNRDTELDKEILKIYSRLESPSYNIEMTQRHSIQSKETVDTIWCPQHTILHQNGETMGVEQPGAFQLLYIDTEGDLQGCSIPARQSWEVSSAACNDISLYPVCYSRPVVVQSDENVTLTVEMTVCGCVASDNLLEMTTGIRIHDLSILEENRPSLVICRQNERKLWDVAKRYRANLSDIQTANDLHGEPSPGQLLLIPIS